MNLTYSSADPFRLAYNLSWIVDKDEELVALPRAKHVLKDVSRELR